ncbi:hypothetical protein EIP91_008901 [Steccherinum ochraceum]|uniref:Uncharacterized protein n=1 Tax=Steccherinum ochraceum TaxID=92696 RepID=A0A4R0RRJ2_9APHY|nr:hypothetical protein EIP91_008901 [Steccherinum ochraceum]
MPSPVRTLFVAFHFAALAAILIFGATMTVVPVLASPIPMPLPSPMDSLDFVTPRALSNASDPLPAKAPGDKRQLGLDGILPDLPRRDINTFIGDIKTLNTYYGQMNQHAASFQKLSRQASATSYSQSGGSGFSQESATELSGFQNNLATFSSLLAQMGADKGLANYDKNNQIETILKNVVNLNKYTLNDVHTMIAGLPTVGPILGPIVYQIKCILDEVLNAVENLTDEILNEVEPLLVPVIKQATVTACDSGLQILGLCIL